MLTQQLSYQYRRDNTLINQSISSQEELQKYLSAITKWRLKYDPYNELFPSIWKQENQTFIIQSQSQLSNITEYKEEEPTPIHFTYASNTGNNGTFFTCETNTNNYDLITSQISENTTAEEESDDPDFDPTEDPEMWNEWEKKKQQNLNKNSVCKKQGLNKQAKEFIPSSQRLDVIDELEILENTEPTQPTQPTEPKTAQIVINQPTNNIMIPVQIPFNQYTIINTLNVNMMPTTLNQDLCSVNQSKTETVKQCDNDYNNIITESKQNDYSNNSMVKPVKPVQDMDDEIFEFEPQCKGIVKGKFFIAKDMTDKMIMNCREKFDTFKSNDDNAAFGYYKESVIMQINDKQTKVFTSVKGDIVILNIDLHFENKTRDIMYLIAMENDHKYKTQVKWKIVDFMNAYEIKCMYNINNSKLPKSSRNSPHFQLRVQNALKYPPENVPFDVIYETDFKRLPMKNPKNNQRKIRISEVELKKCCRESWNHSVMVPVVVVKGKRQWIEWKKFIQIYDKYNNKYEWIGISLRYFQSNKIWKIKCMDYDFGRIYYQHRLVGVNHKYFYKYNELIGFVTTALDIY